MNIPVFITIGVVSIIGGGFLLWFALKKASKRFKKPMLLTGASLVGLVVFSILHNLVYALCIHFFSESLPIDWDEPVFFILAVLVCPIGVLAGLVWISVLWYRGRH